MAETALNETGQHRPTAVPLGPRPPLLRSSVVTQAPWPVDVAPPPAALLARAWLAALAVNGASGALDSVCQ